MILLECLSYLSWKESPSHHPKAFELNGTTVIMSIILSFIDNCSLGNALRITAVHSIMGNLYPNAFPLYDIWR